MPVFTSGTRVVGLPEQGRKVTGTVRGTCSPPGATPDEGVWYVVDWDAMPDIGHPRQDGIIQERRLRRL